MMEYLLIVLWFILGALWRRQFGGWRIPSPSGYGWQFWTPRQVSLAFNALCNGALFWWFTGDPYAAVAAGLVMAYSFTPAGGSKSFINAFDTWDRHVFFRTVQSFVRFQIFHGIGMLGIFWYVGDVWASAVFSAGLTLAVLANRAFKEWGDRWTWLPDPWPAKYQEKRWPIIDGRGTYNEFMQGGFVWGGLAAAVVV